MQNSSTLPVVTRHPISCDGVTTMGLIGAYTAQANPGMGEEETPAVHFITHSWRLLGEKLTRWLVTSIGIGQRIIVLLGMPSGCVAPKGSDAVQATVKRIVNGGLRYILMSRMYREIESLRDGSESARPPDGQIFLAQSVKMSLHTSTHLLA